MSYPSITLASSKLPAAPRAPAPRARHHATPDPTTAPGSVKASVRGAAVAVLVLLPAWALGACAEGMRHDDADGSLGDSGGVGADAGEDAAAADAGTPPPPAPDAATADTGAPADAGPPECAGEWVPPPMEALPRCATATRTCIAACPPGDPTACINGCLAADSTPAAVLDGLPFDCRACLSRMQFVCLDTMGCRLELQSLTCCANTLCGGFDSACMARECADPLSLLQACANSAGRVCGDLAGDLMAGCYEGG